MKMECNGTDDAPGMESVRVVRTTSWWGMWQERRSSSLKGVEKEGLKRLKG
jgi:hypothetical protein